MRKKSKADIESEIAQAVAQARAANRFVVKSKRMAPSRAADHIAWRNMQMAVARMMKNKLEAQP